MIRRIEYARELNQDQLDVVLHADGPCLVLAGAGSGKTRTLTYRVAYLLERGVDPSSILLLTFTNKAAKEMLARVAALIGGEARGIWGGTFHAIANRLLRSFAAPLGYQPNFSILDQEDSRDLVKAVMKDLAIDPKARRFPSASVTHDVISFSRNAEHTFEETLEFKYPHFRSFAPDLEEIARQYQVRKREANAMDFDDLLSQFARLLEDRQIGSRISEPFQFILVDEYQDTNALQARIVSAIGAAHRNVLVVGDDAQSIYAFRGADVKNILSFPKQWPDAKIFKLLTNYRSTPQILDLANESLSHNVEQFEKELAGMAPNGEKPKLVACASAAEEARYIADQMLALRQEGVALRNMAVLFRSSAHSQALEFELVKRDIPYEYHGGQKFFERAHIKDVIAHVRVRANVKDEVAWLRVLALQQGIGAATASALARELARTEQFAQAAGIIPTRLPGRAQIGWQTFAALAASIVQSGDNPSSMIRTILRSSYRDYLEREYPDWRDRLEDLEQLAIFAEGYEELAPFLADISLYDEVVAGRQEVQYSDTERTILSTIHQAKGLEWDTVFIMHLADNAFPNRRALAEEREGKGFPSRGMEEERRLFYVAVTRARRRLFVTYPTTLGHDTLIFNQPSTFIDEVSPRLFLRVEMRSPSARSHVARWDGDGEGYDEPAIHLDARGDRRSPSAGTTVWKK